MSGIEACFGYKRTNGKFIPKKDLIDGAWYTGYCRNTNLAQWDAKNNQFLYVRIKFGNAFREDINHPEDDDGFDLYFPCQELNVCGNVYQDLRDE